MMRFGIKFQILMITLIPVFFIDLFFTYTQIYSNIEQANELLQSKGKIIARQIAGASEFSLYAGHDAQLQYLVDQSVDSNGIVLAAIYDEHGEMAARSVSNDYRSEDSADYFYYRQPILSQSIVHSDVFTTDIPGEQQASTLGWVHMYISGQQLDNTTRQIIIDSITFFVSILLMAIILTVLISRKITQPIIRLMDHMKYVETGRLGKIIEPLEPNELGAVQKGFNRMTQALLANRQHLNQRIQQATQQLSEAITDLESKNRELGIARDEAQNANRTKSEFLANMSHEIRTPINGIKGFISLLDQSNLDRGQRRYVDIILKSTNDLTNIINEILDFSKMESGKLQIIEEEFDLHEVLEQTRDILYINILSKQIDLNLVIFSDTPRMVIGDKLRLKQVLLNLIGNAIKFTDNGRVLVKVMPLQLNDNKADILISIEDTGIGISEQDQENLFKAFSQVDSADNRRFSGTGLGLVISKNLAVLMGGDIEMQSRSGEGSRFDLKLPLKLSLGKDESPGAFLAPLSALIFASDESCLMEVRTLFDRASVDTEASLIDAGLGSEAVSDSIQRNLKFIDLVVFDLRHFDLDLQQILDSIDMSAARVIFVDYERITDSALNIDGVEFISVINTSQALSRILHQQTNDNEAIKALPGHNLNVKRKRVLLVDDNQVNLKLASELIRLWGHEVVEADHGSKAMELYQQQKFDLIILDIQMPDIDGTSLLLMMREHDPEDDTPVVALTANILNHEAERLLDLGFDYYLSKPIDEVSFRSLLDKDIERSQRTQTEPNLPANAAIHCSVDYAHSLSLSANNEDLLKQIFEILLRDIPDYQHQLQDALTKSQHGRLDAIAHKLYGVTCYAGLPKLKQYIKSFQQMLNRQDTSLFDEAVTQINEELQNVKTEVEQHLKFIQT